MENEGEYKVLDRRVPHEEAQVQLVDTSPASLMIAAINKGMDLDKLEKFMALQERYEANEARKAYHEAMAAFKAHPPDIEKDKTVSFPAQGKTTSYNHASLGNVTSKINTALSAHGLSAGWITSQDGGLITVTCTITHKHGHSESTSLTAGPDTSGAKNAIQAVASTISYLERYTILALTGLATHDMDDDGRTSEIQYISADQLSQLIDLLHATNSDEAKFLSFMKAPTIEEIPAKDFQKAYAALTSKLPKGGKK